MRSIHNVLTVILLCCIATTVSTYASAEVDSIASYTGVYVYAGGQAQQTARKSAVDNVVEQMNVLIRGLARRNLLKATEPWQRITVGVSGKNLTLNRGGGVPATVALEGPAVSFSNGFAGRSSVRRRFAKGSIIEVIDDGTSSRTNMFSLSSAGKILSVGSRIRSPHLPQDVVFRFSYKRQ